jgi:nicotinate-nucleotide pyrophosphorylase
MDNLQRLLAMAKAEDLGNGDITGELLPADLSAEARFAAHNAYRDVARGLIK